MTGGADRRRAVVIGAGVAELAAAIDLAMGGLDVAVVERAAEVGGKMRVVRVGPYRIDAGPRVLTMRWVLDDLFADAGADLQMRVPLVPADLLVRHAWDDGSRLDLHADPERNAAAIAELAGAAEAAHFRAFRAYARRLYQGIAVALRGGPRPSAWRLLRERAEALVLGPGGSLDAESTLEAAIEARFTDPRVRQVFVRSAAAFGSSPLRAPAILSFAAHLEQTRPWVIPGGSQHLVDALATLARELGVEIRCRSTVIRIEVEHGRAAGVTFTGGERLSADLIVSSVDIATLAAGHLGEEARRAVRPGRERSLSAVTWSMVARPSGFPLAPQNVFFTDDARAELDALFVRRALPERPTISIRALDREDGGPTGGPERLFCLVDAPAEGDRGRPTAEELDALEARMDRRLSAFGLRLGDAPSLAIRTGPRDFEAIAPGTAGALYGPAYHGWRARRGRPGARTRLRGLYQAGGGAHPGPTLALSVLSGRLASAAALEDLRRTTVPPTAGRRGGASMAG